MWSSRSDLPTLFLALLLMSASGFAKEAGDAAAAAGGGSNTVSAEGNSSRLQHPDADEPVIVVGAGLAGLSATLEVIHEGAKVILIEGEGAIGGNSAKATSGVAACNTEAQQRKHINDSTDLYYSDTMSSGDRENDPVLVDQLVHNSAGSVQWLIDHGVDLSDVNLCGGHSVPRVHWVPTPKEGKPIPVGFNIIQTLKGKILQHAKENPDKVSVRLLTEVIGLVTWNDFVTGVRVKNSSGQIEEVSGKAVVLATGGFSCDRGEGSLLAEFAPDKLKFPTTNGKWARGRGVKMARAMGAALVGMNNVQVHPTAFVDPNDPTATTKFLAAEALRGKGAILLNEKGERFGNELGRRDYLTDRILRYTAENEEAGGAHVAYMVMNDKAADDFGRPAFNFYANVKKLFKKYSNAAEFAQSLHISEDKVKETFSDYNIYAKPNPAKKDPFEKKFFPVEFRPDEPLYVAQITPAIHYTMGGLKIDKNGVVFNEFSQKPFRGLLAAGEVTGGVHGRNRLAGNSLQECVTYGRIAGRNAARIRRVAEPDSAALASSSWLTVALLISVINLL